MLAVSIVVLLVVANMGPGTLSPVPKGTSSPGLTSTAISAVASLTTSGRSASSGSSSSSALSKFGLCAPLTRAQVLANAKVSNSSSAADPNYDEQMLLGFEQNFTGSISYNVTVRAQNDSFGFGPAYLLNGLTDTGHWYQVGIAWNLAAGPGAQFAPGFRFAYEVWDTNTSTAIFPRAGGTIVTKFHAQDGDLALLKLEITPSGQVSMSAFDWNTSAAATASYNSFGASQFLGFKDRVTGFPTSLLTEWYHALPYFCSKKQVTYSNDSLHLSTAWLRIDEWNLTGISASQRFNSSAMGQCCVFAAGYQGISFNEPSVFQSIGANGTAIYANAREFVTP